ncbi:(2Fe-2S)-binding protein [Streptomyces atratus]|uniref:(2Fe-2S)-binding protein n=1 Tax=Streptomyces atratus TaxID=1893 RepID=UPI00365DAF0C
MKITLTVNGTAHRLDVEPRRVLADVLRDDLGLTGTHLGCEHGICGACTVLMDGEPVRACLVLAVQCDGSSVRTVEGLAGPGGEPHPLQCAFSAEHALQCGFCTPGFLMVAAGALDTDPDLADHPEAIAGVVGSNICRCTGYEPIRRAITRGSGTTGNHRLTPVCPARERGSPESAEENAMNGDGDLELGREGDGIGDACLRQRSRSCNATG